MQVKKQYKKVVLAYSGGLDTSIIIPWLKENYGCEVVAVAIDVGQGEELAPLNEKARKTGASKLYIEDVREEFITEYIYPMVKAGAIYEGKYYLGTSIARPLIAKKVVEIAEREGADALCHGCTGKGNDQVRFELTFFALKPELDIIAPWRYWDIKSREDAIDYAAARGIDVPVTKEKIYSMDRNLWHLSHEGGHLEDTWNEPQDDVFHLTTKPELAPDMPEYVELGFEKGIPVSLDGKAVGPIELMDALNALGGKHGIGRVDLVENRLVGMKSRGVYETPGGTILMTAHNELEYICLDKETMHYKALISQKYAELVYNGQWFTPLREALDAFVDKTQETVTGSVRIKLYKGNCVPVSRKSPYSLYNEDLATFGADDIYDQKDSEGFIKLFGLPVKVKALMDKQASK